MNEYLKKIISAVVLFTVIYVTGAYFLDRQFSVNAVVIPTLEQKSHILNNEDLEKIKAILSQPYYYLDRGHQSFAFASEDNQFVLKLFDARDLKSFFLLPNPSQEDRIKSEKKLDILLQGYRCAFEKDRNNCGLVYVQLAPNPELNLVVALRDRFGFSHQINLSKVPFVIQYKAIPTRKMIKSLLDRGETQLTIEFIKKIVDMYRDTYSRGIYDRDHNVIDNTGFLNGRAIRIDAGRLRYNPEWKSPLMFSPDLRAVMIGRIGLFLKKYYPAYREEILSSLEEYLN